MNKNENRRLRIQNFELNQFEQIHRKEILKSLPVKVQIPTNTTCNMRCIFCTKRDGETSHFYRNLTFNEFLKFTPSLKSALAVGLFGWGEPFFNPDYEKMFEYVTKQFSGINIRISTNGTLLNRKWIEKIISHSLTEVNISLNAATSRTYALLMGSNCFDRVINNIKELVKNRGKSSDTYIILSFVFNRYNIDELPRFVELGSELDVNEILVTQLREIYKEHKKLSAISDERKKISFKNALKKAQEGKISLVIEGEGFYHIEKENLNNCEKRYGKSIFSSFFGECYDPWDTFKISESGDVFPCCDADTVMGNCIKQTLEEIWNGKMYRYFRRFVNSSTPPFECTKCTKRREVMSMMYG